ncbi:unnamed protein product [Cyprideis torosa]|uniref:Uncharacterized protein n=1 Tax=Cyprideis torosa TaxID=163714 RepID=A0A7R8ZJX7_9CRUS|nr:unnamed protein product [Cyprideis torosa]CAG0889541.1 unnamed protein product [Cyprideis torosa]
MADGLNEACGVMGCVASQWPSVDLDIPYVICEGLLQLQHSRVYVDFFFRGQESAGIVTSQGEAESPLKVHRGRGMVSSVFASSETLRDLQGNLGIGHTRYSTMGGACPSNQQPFVVHSFDGPLAVAHNGELVNARSLRKMVFSKGVGLSTQSDSELITQILCLLPDQDESPDWGYRIRNLMSLSPVSYSLLILHGSSVYGVRDRFGNRPLCVGKITDGESVNRTEDCHLQWDRHIG